MYFFELIKAPLMEKKKVTYENFVGEETYDCLKGSEFSRPEDFNDILDELGFEDDTTSRWKLMNQLNEEGYFERG